MGYNNLRGATRVGGRPGARPRLAPERGPLRIKKEWRISVSQGLENQ